MNGPPSRAFNFPMPDTAAPVVPTTRGTNGGARPLFAQPHDGDVVGREASA